MRRRSILLGAALAAPGFGGCLSAVRDSPEATMPPENATPDANTASPAIDENEPPSCVDDSVVVRAERVGVLQDEEGLEPDPLEEGDVLECFE